MKILLSTLLFFIPFIINAQVVLDELSNYKTLILPSGLTIITVNTNEFDYINYKVIFDYNPVQEPTANSISFIASYLDLNINGKTQLYTTKVSDTNAVDSMFRFMKNTIFGPTFYYEKIEQTKDKLRRNYLSQNVNILEHKNLSNYFCFGKHSVYSNFLKSVDLDKITNQTLQSIYIKIINPSQTTIVLVGNIQADTVFKYAKINFKNWNISSTYTPFPEVSEPNQTIIHYQADTSINKISTSFPINYFYTDNDYFQKTVLFQLFENKIIKDLKGKIKNTIFEHEANQIAPYFFLFYNFDSQNLETIIHKTLSSIRDMLIFSPSIKDLNSAKKQIINKFKKSLKNPFNIAQYAYLLNKYPLGNDFFKNYITNIQQINSLQLTESASDIFKPDNASIFLQGNINDFICQLHKMAKFHKVEFYDKILNKYKVINKGFDSQYIIDDFLNSSNASSEIKNLTIKFTVQYSADTIYHSKGIIYKKKPDFYYYKNVLIIDKDTLLQKLQIANEKSWFEQSSIEHNFYNKKEDFWNSVFKSSIFPELFYDKFKYTHQIICDSALIKKNIFKIKVSSPDKIIIYDYYDLSLKEKLKTEKIIYKKGIPDTLQIIEYFDYKKISKNSKLRMPFTIKEKTKGFEIIVKIDFIDDKTKIKKTKFLIDPNILKTPTD